MVLIIIPSLQQIGSIGTEIWFQNYILYIYSDFIEE